MVATTGLSCVDMKVVDLGLRTHLSLERVVGCVFLYMGRVWLSVRCDGDCEAAIFRVPKIGTHLGRIFLNFHID